MNFLISLVPAGDTVPLVADPSSRYPLFGYGALFLFLAAFMFTLAYVQRSVLWCVPGILVCLFGVLGITLGVMKPSDVDVFATKQNIEAEFGVETNFIGAPQFSRDNAQKVVPIGSVITSENLTYEEAFFVSRNSEVAVYVLEEGSEEPVPLAQANTRAQSPQRF